MFAFRDTLELDPAGDDARRVEVAFTDASLDVREAGAIATLEQATGVPLARLDQVHGDVVVRVESSTDELPTADAQVTATPGLGLMVRVADCVPVVLADATTGLLGVVHAGRRGVQLGVVGRAVERMRALGATELHAWVGPHICGRCYEVPADLRDEVAAAVPATYAETSWGTPALDLGAGVAAQLADAGVPAAAVRSAPGCTREDPTYPSYRRDGAAAGRFAGLVWRR